MWEGPSLTEMYSEPQGCVHSVEWLTGERWTPPSARQAAVYPKLSGTADVLPIGKATLENCYPVSAEAECAHWMGPFA